MIYEQLTLNEKQNLKRAGIINGCGPYWLSITTVEACYKHDFYYVVGGQEINRNYYDLILYQELKYLISQLSWYKRWFYYSVNWIAYKYLKRSGGQYFSYRDTPFNGTVNELIRLHEQETGKDPIDL